MQRIDDRGHPATPAVPSIGNYSAYPRCQFPMLVTVKRAKNDRSNYRSLLVHAGIGMEESR
jgi:hypothetical protein